MTDQKLLEAKSISKRFGGVQALDDVTLELFANEVLALVGDNGAGKSTLIKTLSGTLTPDAGEIFVEGRRQLFRTPADAKKAGIETVYQDLALVETLNVANNVFLGKEEVRSLLWGTCKILRHRKMEENSRKILSELGISLPDIKAQVNYLSGGQRQCIAVGRAAAFGRKIVLLDEPTAALGVQEATTVLDIIRKLKKHDVSTIIITHNLEHAFLVADRFLVLRLGRVVGSKHRSETDIDEIVKMITGGVFVERGAMKRRSRHSTK
jgi:ABC-type sugar transport system ATPase subunit